MSRKKPLSADRFAPTWEGRCWLDWGAVEVDTHKLREAGGFKVLSYHIYADKKCMNIRYSSSKLWSLRSSTLLEEIKCYDADIICLQDVDHFFDWWQPQLMFIGYDSLWKQRTCESFDHNEGVVIAYKRDLFQLFKTVNVDLNRSADHASPSVQRICCTDDVAIIAFLQPWVPNFLESAVCVCSAMFYDGDFVPSDNVDIRCLQAVYLSKRIEYENRNLHLPVVIGVSLNDEPDSAAYHVFRTGRKQLMPSVPGQVSQPLVEPFSRASVRIFWKPATVTEADPPVLQYVISWRPGGSTDMGFCLSKKVDSGDCLQYATSVNDAGIRSTVALELRCALVSGLSAETPFEFKVAAINEVGVGEWSDASEPIVLDNPRKAPPKEPLRKLRNVTGVMEMREVTAMEKSDWDVNKAYRVDINDPMTCLTPRTHEGLPDREIPSTRLLPISTNPREGWRPQFQGEMPMTLKTEIESSKRVMKSVIMNSSGYYNSVSDTMSSKKAIYDLEEAKKNKEDTSSVSGTERSLQGSLEDGSTIADSVTKGDEGGPLKSNNDFEHGEDDEDDDTFKYQYDEFEDDDRTEATEETESTATGGNGTQPPRPVASEEIKTSMENMPGTAFSTTANKFNDLMLNDGTITTINEESSWEAHGSASWAADKSAVLGSIYGELLNAGGDRARRMNDDVIIDLKEAIETVGRPNKRHLHSLGLRSVYEAYGVGGEPLYTTSVPEKKNYKGVRCVDYIFFSAASMRPSKLLSIPVLTKLSGDNPQESLIAPDPYWGIAPPGVRDLFDNHKKKLPQLKTKAGKPSKGEIDTMKRRLEDVLKSDIPSSSLWGGKWIPLASPSLTRAHSWLPNDSYCSSHIALSAHFQINEDYKATEWV